MRGARIPAVGAVRRPSRTFGGYDMHKEANAGRGHGRSVEIEETVHLGVR